MPNKVEKPQKSADHQELDGSLTRQFDNDVISSISRFLEPLYKWLVGISLSGIGWALFLIYGLVSSIPAMQQRINVLEKSQTDLLAQIKDLPSRVQMLEKDRDNTIEAQRRSEQAQAEILKQLSELKGFINGINAQPKPQTMTK